MLQTMWAGLGLGAIYSLVAFGFTISLLPSGIVNFAQGAIVVTGAYLTYQFLAVDQLNLIVVIALNAVIGVALGIICELVCVRPLRRTVEANSPYGELVTTIGASTAIVGALGIGWGYLPKAVPYTGSTSPVRFLGVAAQPSQITVLAIAIVAAFGLHVWFRRTRWGQACLAVAEDREAATLRGINVSALSLAGFAAAGAFATLSAIAIGPISYAVPALANTLALGGFVALALGGHGRFIGSLFGGLLAGTVSSLATRYLNGSYADLSVLVLLVVTLLVRPAGLGVKAARRV